MMDTMIQTGLTLPKQKLPFRYDLADGAFVEGTLEQLPEHIREDIQQEYASRYLSTAQNLQSEKTRSANEYLRAAKDIVSTVSSPLGISPGDDRDTLTVHAQRLAGQFAEVFTACSPITHVASELAKLGVSSPVIPHGSFLLDDGVMVVNEDYASKIAGMGVSDMIVLDDDAYKAKRHQKRLTSPRWWLGTLGRESLRLAELQYQRLGMVHCDNMPYVSNYTLAVMAGKDAMNREYMKSQEAVSVTDGRVLDMETVMDAGVSNLSNRRNELATRLSHSEEWINEQHPDYACIFFSPTCPSIFHPMKKIGGYTKRNKDGRVVRKIGGKAVKNPKYEPTVPFTKGRGKNAITIHKQNTPRIGNEWIKEKWADFRTWLKDSEIDCYFVRATEPQHDGTPHWHGLLWIPGEHMKSVKKALRKTYLSDYGDEQGAWKHRIDIKVIDKKKGSAAGYLMKYISKNIDGHGLNDGDHETGLDAATSAQRVTAWRKVWGIRAFQFSENFAPVTIWRELRRLTHEHVADRPQLAKLREVADKGDWKGYITLLETVGGGTRKGVIDLRDGSGITNPLDWNPGGIAPTEPEDLNQWLETFLARLPLAKTNQYGEIVPRVIGVQAATEASVYRDTIWEIRHKEGCETWLDKLKEMSAHSSSWHAAGGNALSSVLAAEPPLGLVKNNYGTETPIALMDDWKGEIWRSAKAEFTKSRVEPHKDGNKRIREKFPTWEKYSESLEKSLNNFTGYPVEVQP